MIQKVLKVGSSAAVTIPKKSLKELGIKPGDKVSVEVDASLRTLSVRASTAPDKELIDWSRAFIKRYKPALDALSKQ
jgi:antitoxin component of MazEF toxin-antitoxin module